MRITTRYKIKGHAIYIYIYIYIKNETISRIRDHYLMGKSK